MAPRKERVCVIGRGRMAATLAALAARGGADTCLCPGTTEGGGENAFRGLRVPRDVRVHESVDRDALAAPLVIVATGSARVAELFAAIGERLRPEQYVIHAARGLLDADGEPMRVSQVIARESAVRKIGAIAGPFLAEEAMAGEPAALVAASGFAEVLAAVRDVFDGTSASVFRSDDLAGVEIASALAPVYAIAAGIAAGGGFGVAARAALLARSLAEMAAFGQARDARAQTFSGLSGLGDLFTLVAGEDSAPFEFGKALAAAPRSTARKAAREKSETVGNDVRVREAVCTAALVASAARIEAIDMPVLAIVARAAAEGRAKPGDAAALVGARDAKGADAVDPGRVEIRTRARTPQGGRGKT
ncbi:MAG: hypothetical protein IT350_17135 [Deltaproteobacteria bacterium]|nr:hypothetical protein [Deltaproteobacteria bacterium]